MIEAHIEFVLGHDHLALWTFWILLHSIDFRRGNCDGAFGGNNLEFEVRFELGAEGEAEGAAVAVSELEVRMDGVERCEARLKERSKCGKDGDVLVGRGEEMADSGDVVDAGVEKNAALVFGIFAPEAKAMSMSAVTELLFWE